MVFDAGMIDLLDHDSRRLIILSVLCVVRCFVCLTGIWQATGLYLKGGTL